MPIDNDEPDEATNAYGSRTSESGALPPGCSMNEDLRREIAVSWWRSQLLGVKPELPVEAIPEEPLLDADERLRRLVEPILEELAINLSGTNSGVILADHRAVILDSRGANTAMKREMDRLAIMAGFAFGEGSVGTNGIGSVVEERRLVRVSGTEHYLDILKHLACFGVPLVHPLTRRLVGILTLTFPPAEEHPLMPSYLRDAGKRVEHVLADSSSIRERSQFECFMSLTRRSRRPVLSSMNDTVLLNRGARNLHPVDQAAILQLVGEVGETHHGTMLELPLGDGQEPMFLRVHTHSDHGRFPGVVVEVLPGRARRSITQDAEVVLPGLVGTSPVWKMFCEEARRAADQNVPVLFFGEAGTGKLACARALHELSRRPQFVVLDVASVVVDSRRSWLQSLRAALNDVEGTVVIRHLQLCDSLLAAAVGAEIDRTASVNGRLMATMPAGPVPEEIQPLLDRFLLHLEVPPLDERRDDVECLVTCFVNRRASGLPIRFHPAALASLRAAHFPGNVRQLETLVCRLASTRGRGDILATDLPPLGAVASPHLSPIERAEREAIVKAMRDAGGNKAVAAAHLGISRPTLYRKLSTYGIEVTT